MNLSQIKSAIESCEMAEIRLDRCILSPEDILECFSADIPLVATCRISEIAESEKIKSKRQTGRRKISSAAKIAEERLIDAINAGADYVDVEMDAPKPMIKRICKAAHENGAVLICSYHDYNGTPDEQALERIVKECRSRGADIVKVATMANSEDDVKRVMSLYDKVPDSPLYEDGLDIFLSDNGLGLSLPSHEDGQKEMNGFPAGIVAFCMGDLGRQSRVDCLRKGSPFTYAALAPDAVAAPGQWPASEMAAAVYGRFHFCGGRGKDSCSECGSRAMTMPSSKSIAQRAIIAAALADGESCIENCTPCSDTLSAIEVAKKLGSKTEETPRDDGTLSIRIKGIAAAASSVEIQRLNVGESALLARLMMQISAQISTCDVLIAGEKTLLRRSMNDAKESLSAFGAGADNFCLPLKVTGPLKSGRAVLSGKNGSQSVSGLLMALPLCDEDSEIKVTAPQSIPYLLLTLDILKRFKIRTSCEFEGTDLSQGCMDYSSCSDITFKIKGGQRYKAANVKVEGDWSSAAAFLVAGAVFGSVQIAGLNTSSIQADCAIIDILSDAGAIVSQTDGESGPVSVRRAPLWAFHADVSNCPDLFPVIAVLAAFCHGTSRISGTNRLACKECDRAETVVGMLTQAGVKAWIEDNVLVVEGQTLAQRIQNGTLLNGGRYSSRHDHRMVMALKIASLGADSPIEIDDVECVAKSFPDFIRLFDML